MKKYLKRAGATFMALMLTVAVMAGSVMPAALAAENLQIVVHNNDGLPHMKEGQFRLYQIFKGTATKEKESDSEDPDKTEWNGQEWDNYTLGDIEWGDSMLPAGDIILTLLRFLDETEFPWAYVNDEGVITPSESGGKNAFADAKSAAGLAKVLEGKSNEFMQGFAAWLAHNNHLNWPPLAGQGAGPKEGYSEKVNKDDANPKNDTTVFTVPEPGYYLLVEVDNDAVVSEYIFSVLGSQEVDLKGTAPTVDKDILGGGNAPNGDAAGVTDVVTFELTGTLPKNFADYKTYEYYFHDNLSAGLSFDGTASSKDNVHAYVVKGEDGTVYELNLETGFTVDDSGATGEFPADDTYESGSKVTFKFDNLRTELSYTKSYTKNAGAGDSGVDTYTPVDSAGVYTPVYGDQIIVTYQAKVNEKDVIGSTGNPNSVVLEYSNDPNFDGEGDVPTGHTPKNEVYIYSFGLDLKKVGDDLEHQEQLPGAGFVLYNKENKIAKFQEDTASQETPKPMVLVGWEDPSTTFQGLYNTYKEAADAYAKATEAEKVEKQGTMDTALQAMKTYVAVSGSDGQLPNLQGLDEGDYRLSEVVTPAGYNTMDDINVTISAFIDLITGKLLNVTYTSSTGKGDKVYSETVDEGTVFKSGLLPDTLVNEQAPFLPHTGGIGAALVIAVFAAGFGVCALALRKASKKNGAAEE